ncbi:hypothetical protein N3K66_006972 [Trichothecium roseum]|uniref:Uncharacterized protein n=1 Tax=Trichothecium roseum TaxID=47278 RepID=A0ACC0UWU7_9HYPO|nr:hypothetical protein N3K66_006972 [Trichothecium roseum]
MCVQSDFRPPQVPVRLECGHEVRATAEFYWVMHNIPAEAQTLDGEPFYLEELCVHCSLDDALRSQLQHVLVHHPETSERSENVAFAVWTYVDAVLEENPEFLPTLIRETVPARWLDEYNAMVGDGLGKETFDHDSNSDDDGSNGDASLDDHEANEAGPNATQAADDGSEGLDNHEADEAGPDTIPSRQDEVLNVTQAVDNGPESNGGFGNDRLNGHRSGDDAPVSSLGSSTRRDGSNNQL